MLGGRTSQVDDQDQIVWSENQCYSFIGVASIDGEKTANERLLSMTIDILQ